MGSDLEKFEEAKTTYRNGSLRLESKAFWISVNQENG